MLFRTPPDSLCLNRRFTNCSVHDSKRKLALFMALWPVSMHPPASDLHRCPTPALLKCGVHDSARKRKLALLLVLCSANLF